MASFVAAARSVAAAKELAERRSGGAGDSGLAMDYTLPQPEEEEQRASPHSRSLHGSGGHSSGFYFRSNSLTRSASSSGLASEQPDGGEEDRSAHNGFGPRHGWGASERPQGEPALLDGRAKSRLSVSASEAQKRVTGVWSAEVAAEAGQASTTMAGMPGDADASPAPRFFGSVGRALSNRWVRTRGAALRRRGAAARGARARAHAGTCKA
jgi:hypothetical protein